MTIKISKIGKPATHIADQGKTMGILGNIFSKIFPSSHAAPDSTISTPPATAAPSTPSTTAQQAPAATPSPTASIIEVDVEAILNDLAKNNPQKLNWRTSIVDLLKLLDLDSSLAARKELAQELHYTGDPNDSASMNI
jgi:hypothetical protein